MDAFEKLAELAGASVESVGEGLPRTRAEAKALGVTRYFTGKPCPHGHAAERTASDGYCCECHRQRNAAPERTEQMRQRDRVRNATPERKDRARLYKATPEYKEQQNQRAHLRNLARVGDEILFSINQAWMCAARGKVAYDIVPQCPEPQRSQLQALVDRIKADPQAGKAVVGLLRTMRELRKVELAEMRAASEGGAA